MPSFSLHSHRLPGLETARPCATRLAFSRPARGLLKVRATQPSEKSDAEAKAQPESSTTKKANEIYLGFPKGDYAPREGRKGRVIEDDPELYPGRDELGLAGGWAGGEVALKSPEFLEAVAAGSKKESVKKEKASPALPKLEKGKEFVYLGHGKEDYEARREGLKGKIIVDEADKYPDKEDIGALAGMTGGFAGGERGLQMFIEKGEVLISKEPDGGSRQFSPLGFAGLVAGAGVIGGLLLNYSVEVGEEVVKDVEPSLVGDLAALQGIAANDNTKYFVQFGLSALLAVGAIIGATVVVKKAATSVTEGTQKFLTLAVFWVVFLVAIGLVASS